MKKIILVALFLMGAVPAWAYVLGPSNFVIGGYPDHRCTEPFLYPDMDEFAYQTFKISLAEYTSCIEDYVAAAENDQKRVLESANEAIEEYNNFIRSL